HAWTRFACRHRNLHDADRMRRARLHARRRLAGRKAPVAHVALPHDAEAFRVLRHVVRALQDAVTASDALVVEVADDAGNRILFVREDGAAAGASRGRAMVACAGDRLLERVLFVAPDEKSDVAPGLLVIETVQCMASGDAGLAARARVQVDLEGILLADAGG